MGMFIENWAECAARQGNDERKTGKGLPCSRCHQGRRRAAATQGRNKAKSHTSGCLRAELRTTGSLFLTAK